MLDDDKAQIERFVEPLADADANAIITAIAAHINCIRGIERYGVGTIEQAFTGYVGLPSKGSTWKTTLGFAVDADVTIEMVEKAFRERARSAHPDIQGREYSGAQSPLLPTLWLDQRHGEKGRRAQDRPRR